MMAATDSGWMLAGFLMNNWGAQEFFTLSHASSNIDFELHILIPFASSGRYVHSGYFSLSKEATGMPGRYKGYLVRYSISFLLDSTSQRRYGRPKLHFSSAGK